MPGNYSRINVEADGNILTAANYNAEHDNHITNHTPAGLDDYSVSVSQANTQTDPGETGSESLPTSIAGELERIRFMLAEITGQSLWRSSPTTNLNVLSTPQGLHVGLEFEGKYDGASTTTDVLAKLINRGAVVNSISLETADVDTSDFDSTNKKFGNFSYLLGASNILAFPGTHGNPLKGSLSCWTRNLASSDYVAYNPLLGLEFFINGSSKLVAKITERTPATETTKSTSSVIGDDVANYVTDMASTFRNLIMRWALGSVDGAATDQLGIAYSGTLDSSVNLSTQTFNVNAGLGGYWFIGAKRNDPATWDHFSAMSVLPSAEAVNPWSSVGTTAGNSVSDGVLRITGQTSTQSNAYQLTGATVTGVNLAQMTIEFKLKVNSAPVHVNSGGSTSQDNLILLVRDDSMDRSMQFNFFDTLFRVRTGPTAANEAQVLFNTRNWHTYRIVSSGSPSPNISVYIDGIKIGEFNNAAADATANDLILFGDNTTTAGATSDSEWEYIAFADEIAAPVTGSSQGNIDSLGISSTIVSGSTLTALQGSPVTSVFNSDPNYGPYLPLTIYRSADFTTTNTSFEDIDGDGNQASYYLGGDGMTEYSCDFSGTLMHDSAAGDIELSIRISSIDGDTGGSATRHPEEMTIENIFAAATEAHPFFLKRSFVLPVGLFTVRPIWRTSTGTATINLDGCHAYITKQEKL